MTDKKPYAKDPTHGATTNRNSKYQVGRSTAGNISWGEVDGPVIKRAIDAVTSDGCAIVFSRTSDGGALVLTLLDGPNRVKEYANAATEAQAVLGEWVRLAGGKLG